MSWKFRNIEFKDIVSGINFSFLGKLVLVLALSSFCLRAGITQSTLRFRNFTQQDGLASNYILSILQDHQGFMWIGTENGLDRFDGRHFLSFRSDPADPETLSGNWIWAIHEDSRHRLWIGTERGLNRMDRQTGKIERIPLIKDELNVETTVINDIYESSSGSLWITTPKNGLFRLEKDPKRGKWRAIHFDYDQGKGSSRNFNIAHATGDELWVVHSKGIDYVHIPSKKTVRYAFPKGTISFTGELDKIFGLFDGKSKIYAGFNHKLFVLNISGDQPAVEMIKPFDASFELGDEITRTVIFDRPEVLLFASYRNLVSFNLENGELEQIQKEGQTTEHLFPDPVHAIYKDRQGIYWIGTHGGGLYIGQNNTEGFFLYQHEPNNPASISSGQVRTFLEEKNGGLWIGIIDHGLEHFVPQEDLFLKKDKMVLAATGQPNALASDRVIKLIQGIDQSIWVATNDHGLIKLDAKGKPLETFTHRPGDPYSLSGNRIWGLAADRYGYIWAGTWLDGLNRLDPKTGQVKRYLNVPNYPKAPGIHNIRNIYIDRQGILWIGTEGGLVRYDQEKEQFSHFQHSDNDPHSLSDNIIWAIYEDRHGFFWIGTNTGLNRYDPSNHQFEQFYEKHGLPDNSIYGILEDDEGLLWVSTKNGLARQSSGSSAISFRSLGVADGLPATAFVPKAYLNSALSDQLFFGSSEGILAVRPKQLQEDTSRAHLVIHEMKRFKRRATSGAVVTDYFVNDRGKTIHLGYEDQSVTFILSDLNRISHPTYKYEYQLVGFNQQWTPLEENMQLSFSNLDPGTYHLQVRAKTLENIPLSAVDLLSLRVFPPWWKSWWAYLIYIVMIGAVTFTLFRFYLKRQLEKKEAEHLKTLDAFKNKLFTNITHEFRTPLTIISGMTGQIKKKPDLWLEEGTELIQKNTDNLLNLINQILELQKLEFGSLKADLQQGDILPFLQNILYQFQAFAQSKEQRITFDSQMDELIMDYDPEKILRIVSNLLSNAIKYTPERGRIILQVSSGTKSGLSADQCLILTVKDNGPGIPEDQLPYIFNRFFQAPANGKKAHAGTGVGLSLTHELVKLLGGKIEVDSREKQGTTFQVFLPVTREAARREAIAPVNVRRAVFGSAVPNESSQKSAADDLPLALLVEDNADIAQYLQICLEDHFRIEVAPNGRAGIDSALESIPDIIISDVMMPEKDGFELCEALKEDFRTSHIPIILLTAKSDVESRIVGLKQGADDYLAKPFHEEELLVRMQNLLDIRKKLQERYQNLYEHPIPQAQASASTKEDEFILELKVIFEEKMDDPQFDLNLLSRALHLSRSQLGRKVKALTGRSLSVYLRSLRLQKARQLLLSSDLPMKAIAYDVGFSNPSYFSASYTEEFGESPTNTRDFGQMRK